ncbi:MAG: transglutaminase domain-containing protein [Clostridia bacterium]|nr:transglutaminase domain-containing protein [Clostridia bacterium]
MKKFLTFILIAAVAVLAVTGYNYVRAVGGIKNAFGGLSSMAAAITAQASSDIKQDSFAAQTSSQQSSRKSVVIKPTNPISSAKPSSGKNPVVPLANGGKPITKAQGSTSPSSSVKIPDDFNVYEYGRTLLSAKEAACYDAMRSGVQSLQKTIRLPYAVNQDTFQKIFWYYLYDHAEVFYIKHEIQNSQELFDVSLGLDRNNLVQVIYLQYQYDAPTIAKMETQMKNSAKALLAGVTAGMSESRKVKLIHDTFIQHTRYDLAAVNNPSSYPSAFDAYGALVNHTAVCDGYAKALKLLLNSEGIESLYITGTGVTSKGEGSHAWNMAKIGSKWYWVDATFDDPVYSTSDALDSTHETDLYLEMKTVVFKKTHIYSTYSNSDEENYTILPAVS